MKILVCITHVPETTSHISFTDGDTEFNKEGTHYIIGPYDDYALARAVELKEQLGGTITVLNVGEIETEPTLRKALAIGADDAIRINSFPKDALFVAKEIATVAQKNDYDMILMGRESIDFNGGQVHGMVGELLGIPSVSPVMTLAIEGSKAKMTREIEGGKEFIELRLPFVVGCQEPIAEWKIANMRGIMSARTKPLKVQEPRHSTTKVKVKKFETLPPKKGVKMIDATDMDQLANLLKHEAKII